MAQDNQIKVELTAVDKNLAAVFAKAEASMGMLAASGSKIDAVFSGIGKGVALVGAALAGGSMFTSMVSKAKEVVGEVDRLAKAFGMSAEEASVLRIALDDNFISIDTFTAANSRLTKQIVGGGDAIKRLGIDFKDANGNLKPSLALMLEINSALAQFKEGRDRDVEAQKIYGKGWEEFRQILKLTSGGMDEAIDRAHALGLVFSGDSAKSVKAYKLAMKDLDDVHEAISTRIGMILIPSLTKLSIALGNLTLGVIDELPKALADTADQMDDFWQVFEDVFTGNFSGERIDAGTQRITALQKEIADLEYTLKNTGDPIGDFFKKLITGSQEDDAILIKNRINNLKEAIEEQARLMAQEFVSITPDGKKTKVGGNKRSDGAVPKESNFGAAKDKELQYLKAVQEARQAIIKSGLDFELTQNDAMYAMSRESFAVYISKELSLRQQLNDSAVASKRKELTDAQQKLSELQPVVGKKGEGRPDKDEANRYELLIKIAAAEKALTEAEAKEKTDRLTNALKFDKLDNDHLQKLLQTGIAVADLNGDYDKSIQLQGELLKKQLESAQNNSMEKEKIDLIKAQIAENDKLLTVQGSLQKGFADVAKEWGSHAKNMVDVGAVAAKALQTGFSDFFFDAMQGKLKTLGDYLSSFINSMQRALADLWSKELVAGLKGSGGSMLSGIASIFGFHSGGIIGTDAASFARSVSPLAFAGAERYHGGLMPDEFPAILQKGEGVFTRGQMAALGGGSGGSSTVINIIEAPGRGGQQQQRQGSNGVSIVDVFVEQIKAGIAGDIARGSGAVPNALQTTYGLNRTAGAY